MASYINYRDTIFKLANLTPILDLVSKIVGHFESGLIKDWSEVG